MNRVDAAREAIHAALAAVTPFDTSEDSEMPEGGVLTGWAIIAEWQGTDGNRWLSKMSSDATGSKSLPTWTARGFCSEVVFNWPDEETT